MRNLASVVTVKDIMPMDGKDRIVCVSFNENAYECIIPKTSAIKGNKLAFIQEGAILPVTAVWEFLRKRCYSEKMQGFVIKPMVMGKKESGERVKSWGLAVGLNELGLDEKVWSKLKPNDDLTELLNIRKYEPEEDASPKQDSLYPKWVKFCLSHFLTRWIGQVWQNAHKTESCGFPSEVISKSDETTIQNIPFILEKFANEKVYVTAKMEGQSVTALFDYDEKKNKLGKFYVCSRNNAYKRRVNNDFWNTAVRLDIENKIKNFYKETGILLVIQAEQCGVGIQKNIYDLPFTDWFVYTMKNRITGRQLTFDEMMMVCNKLELRLVPPICGNFILKKIMPDVASCVAYAERQYWKPVKDETNYRYLPADGEKLWEDYLQHEGIVVRSMDYDKDKNIGFSFKVKNIQYSEMKLENIHSIACKIKAK